MTAIADCGHKGFNGVKQFMVPCGECYECSLRLLHAAQQVVAAAEKVVAEAQPSEIALGWMGDLKSALAVYHQTVQGS